MTVTQIHNASAGKRRKQRRDSVQNFNTLRAVAALRIFLFRYVDTGWHGPARDVRAATGPLDSQHRVKLAETSTRGQGCRMVGGVGRA